MRQGFTLIQISILLTLASLVFVATLPSTRSTPNGNTATTAKMNTILAAVRQYQTTNAALPCPADGSQPMAGTYFGVAATNAGATNNCSGGTPAANYTDTTNHIAIGTVPVRTLGLPSDYAIDAFGHDITYAVDTNATVCFYNSLTGQINVTDNGTSANTIAALISHGQDGHGAWIPLPGSSGAAVRLNANSSDTDEHMVNAHGLSGGGFPSNYSAINSTVTSAESTSTTFVRKPATSTFDDIVVYKSNLWTLNNQPASLGTSMYPTVAVQSGSFYANSAFTFTVTFPQAVTVSTSGGTPRIGFTMKSGSAYATYQSGSGSTALTFSYTVQSADYSPNGLLSVTTPIATNGGSITYTSGGLPPCLGFATPTLTNTLVNPVVIYVADAGNNRILKFLGNGTIAGQFGCSGSAPCSTGTTGGTFNGPSGVAIDGNGNIWVADTYNNRIQELDLNGNFLRQIGCSSGYCSGGTGNTAVSQPWAIAIDSSNDIWVTEMGNYRVHEFSGSSYGNVLKFGSQGTTKSQFEQPKGIAIDTGGNVWVADITNNNIQEFNSSGTWQKQLGCSGSSACPNSSTTAGQFYGPAGVTFDSTSNHYLWVTEVFNSRVQELNSSTGTEIAQMPCTTLGQDCTYSTANGYFEAPAGLAFDSSSNLWTVESNGNRMQEFSGMTWQATYTASSYGSFNQPSGIAIGR